jgi:Fe-S oxidoreductase
MKKTRETAYCCGGGGTGLLHEIENITMNQTRVDHAKEQDADCIAVACPICLQMLDDGVKSRNYKMEVKDIAQLIKEAL